MSPAVLRAVAVVGPTGSGKSQLALRLAKDLDGELVGCDSVQVYRGFDIGSAKASPSERQQIPHHLLDLVNADEDYDAARFARDAKEAIAGIAARSRLPIIVGGTGLYLRALLQDAFHQLPKDEGVRASLARRSTTELLDELRRLDPSRAAGLHPNDRVRLLRSLEVCLVAGRPYSELVANESAKAGESEIRPIIFLHPERSALHQRIEARTLAMLASGLVKEVQGLLAAGVSPQAKPMQSIGYAEVAAYLRQEMGEEEILPRIVAATRQYAKRQITWFKKLESTVCTSFGDEPATYARALSAINGRLLR